MTRTRYKILPGDAQPYFVTATTVNWLPLFSNPDIAGILFESLKFLQNGGRTILYAFVLMENHLHLVVSGEHLAKELGNFKSYTARQSIDYYHAHGNDFILDQLAVKDLPVSANRQYQFWQEGVGPKRIFNREMMCQKIEYIHNNPVERGYVEAAEHWRYSSARNYAGMAGMIEVCTEW